MAGSTGHGLRRAVLLAVVILLALPASASAAGKVSGTVTNPSGEPVEAVEVTAHGNSAYALQSSSATTDADGEYSIDGLSAGGYTVEFQPGGEASPKRVEVELFDGDDRRIDVSISVGARISGRVTDQAGEPVVGACASARRGAVSTTDSAGRYVIKQVTPGVERVQFQACRGGNFHGAYSPEFSIAEGEIRTGEDIVLRPAAGISGRVTDAAGQPLHMICVTAGPHSMPTAPTPFFSASDYTGEDGTYRLEGLGAGRYDVNFHDCGPTPELIPQFRRIELADGQELSGVDVALSAGGRITGRVVDYAGTPMANVCVTPIASWAFGADSPDARKALRAARAQRRPATDADGNYVTPGMPDGRYVVEFTTCPWLADPSLFGKGTILTQYYRGQSEPKYATPIQIVNGQSVHGVNARLVDSPDPCVVPQLTGRRIGRAEARIDRTTCRAGKVRRMQSKKPSGRVIAQTPVDGSVRPKKARVKLVVSAG
jgi:hypothetical protein